MCCGGCCLPTFWLRAQLVEWLDGCMLGWFGWQSSELLAAVFTDFIFVVAFIVGIIAGGGYGDGVMFAVFIPERHFQM